MKEHSWQEVKEAANRCFWIMQPKTESLDVTKEVYNNCLPQILKDIAVHALIYDGSKFGQDLATLRNALYQLHTKGFIGSGKI